MPTYYNLENIRALLTEGFTYEELRYLCYDKPDFRPVYDQLAQETGKDSLIHKLVEYAGRKEFVEILLAIAQERNPAKYEKHQPYVVTVDSNVSGRIYEKSKVLDKPLSSPNKPFSLRNMLLTLPLTAP